jgi:hypothetical protein
MVRDERLARLSLLTFAFSVPLLVYGLIATDSEGRFVVLVAAAIFLLLSVLTRRPVLQRRRYTPARLVTVLGLGTAAAVALHVAGLVDAGVLGLIGALWTIMGVEGVIASRRTTPA